jgi:hypothetical protein
MTLAAALLSSFSSSNAQAASGLYLGAGIGQATIKDTTSAGDVDASNGAYKVFAGYRFNIIPIIDLAAEAGYTDFGKPSQNVGGQNVEYKLHGFNAAGLLIFPLGPFDLYGKYGVNSWSLDASVGGTSQSKTGSDPFYGVGFGFYFWKVGIRAEYEQYKIKDLDRPVQMYNVNALFQF